jgi:hypothetical protein
MNKERKWIVKKLTEQDLRGMSTPHHCGYCNKENIDLYRTNWQNLRHYETQITACESCVKSFESEEN